MDFLIDSLHEALHDTWMMLPLLYVVYLFLDSMERKTSQNDSFFWNLQKYGPLFGALLGLVPQCGFSVLAAILYVSHNITLGTMIAVLLATSDEAVPVLISEPDMIPWLGLLLVIKFAVAWLAGTLIDHVLFPHQQIVRFGDMQEEEDSMEDGLEEENQFEKTHSGPDCSCCYPQYPVWISAFLRTIKIYLFVFLVTFGLNLLTGWIGEERLASFLQSSVLFQPLLASVFGLIPNCAATVILCQLFASQALSFGSLVGGLLSNAGLGLIALFHI